MQVFILASYYMRNKEAAERFGVDARDILIEIGRRKAVGGQEDMILEVAGELKSGIVTA